MEAKTYKEGNTTKYKDQETAREHWRKYRRTAKGKEKNDLWRRKNNLYVYYGISVDDYASLLEKQEGKCATCGATSFWENKGGRLGVDHCHVSKKIRGLLCHNCNLAMGHAKDSPELLRRMAAYLEIV